MYIKVTVKAFLIGAVLMNSGCRFSRKTAERGTTFTPVNMPGPALIIYKTKKDYSKFVPVFMNDDKTEIVSYPAPADLVDAENKPVLPVRLRRNYWMDVRGINKNVAYLDIKIIDYIHQTMPSKEFLMAHLMEKFPLEEYCNCGWKDPEKDNEKLMNRLIKDGTLRSLCTPEI